MSKSCGLKTKMLMKKLAAKNKIAIIFFLIVVLGAFLRIYDFDNLARFNADQARDARIVDKMLEGAEFPLLGPNAGGTEFKLGPAFYYLEYFSALVFGKNPAGMAFIAVVLGTLSVPLLFVFLMFYFSPNFSLVLTFFYAISFYAVKYSRFAWNPNIIPFFMLSFLIVILKIIDDKKPLFWNIIAGVIMGIGTQLHTLLIFFMPALFLFAHFYLIFVKKTKVRINCVFLAFFIVIIFNSPLFLYDIRNNNENQMAFWSGFNKKTGNDLTVSESFFQTGQFFAQGNFYVLAGYEPKNWMNARKLISARDFSEIAIAASAVLFSFFSLILIVKSILKEKNEKRKIFLELIAIILVLFAVIFGTLSDELNIRFFVAFVFLPFVLLGIIMKYAKEKTDKKFFYTGAILMAVILTFYNLKTYKNTYDLENFSGKNSAYGGISLMEARDISKFMSEIRQNNEQKDRNFYFRSFEFERSVEYFNKKNGFSFLKHEESKENARRGDIIFWIAKNKNIEKITEEKENSFSLAASREIGRFAVLVLIKK